ncbi:MAG: hypothetical protein ACKVZ0_15000 [Gemmatimonadales bacterium]
MRSPNRPGWLVAIAAVTLGASIGARPPATTAVHIGDLDGNEFPTSSGGAMSASVLVMVHDAEHRPVTRARVRGSWSDGVSGSSQCETGTDGTCPLASRRFVDQQGLQLILAIRGIEGSELSYDKAANHDVDGETNGTTIRMFR